MATMKSRFPCLTCGVVVYESDRPLYTMWLIVVPLVLVSVWHRFVRCPGKELV